MAKKGSGKRPKDKNFKLAKKIVAILAFIIGFAAMTYFIVMSL
ncbi:hypothetical protein [Methanocella paludicola]|nr:hypothetical protein [Methanocella paludicola]